MENEKTPLYVAFSTQKGGVGKTTFTVLAASYLYYLKGYNVAVVDCDYPQHSIAGMRKRDAEQVGADEDYKRMAYEQFTRLGKKAYPVLCSSPEKAIATADGYIAAGHVLLMVREMYLAGNTPLLRPYPTASLSLKIPRLFTTPPMPILLIFTLLMQMTAQPPKRFTVLQVKMLPGILQMVFSPFPVRVHLISPRMKTIVSPFLPLRAATVSGAARHGSP